jgi:hypothetical protein
MFMSLPQESSKWNGRYDWLHGQLTCVLPDAHLPGIISLPQMLLPETAAIFELVL